MSPAWTADASPGAQVSQHLKACLDSNKYNPSKITTHDPQVCSFQQRSCFLFLLDGKPVPVCDPDWITFAQTDREEVSQTAEGIIF